MLREVASKLRAAVAMKYRVSVAWLCRILRGLLEAKMLCNCEEVRFIYSRMDNGHVDRGLASLAWLRPQEPTPWQRSPSALPMSH